MSAGTGVFVGQQLIRVVQTLPRISAEPSLMCSAWRVLFPVLSSRRSQHLIVFSFVPLWWEIKGKFWTLETWVLCNCAEIAQPLLRFPGPEPLGSVPSAAAAFWALGPVLLWLGALEGLLVGPWGRLLFRGFVAGKWIGFSCSSSYTVILVFGPHGEGVLPAGISEMFVCCRASTSETSALM